MTVSISKLLLAEGLITTKKYGDALILLKELDESTFAEEEMAYYELLFLESCLPMGIYGVAKKLDFIIEYYGKSIHHDKYARAKSCEGFMLSAIGKYHDARESYISALMNFRRTNNQNEQAVVLNRLAFLYNHIGDIRQSVDYLNQCFSLIDKNDASRRNTISINLALQLRKSGAIGEALRLYNNIINEWDSKNKKTGAVLYTMSSIPHALLGDFIKAKEVISKAVPFLKDYIRERAIYYETLGWIYNLEGKYSEGLAELAKGLKIAEEIAPESALMSQIKRRMADSYLGLKDFKLAELFAKEALFVAEQLNERVEIAECHRIQAQLACLSGDQDEARKLFKQAIDMFNMIGTRYNLAACRYLAAISGLYHNGERQAMLYLAREYFASEGVSHYVERIDVELKKNGFATAPINRLANSQNRIIAASREMQRIVKLAEMIAPSRMSILLTGETGTGKDLLAQYIHDCSGCEGRFVHVNIAAIPETMLEAELFGHRKGAFTGADSDRIGLIEQAAEGTLFLNEIADASPAMQAKLLAVIENHRLRRLGENEERTVSFRLLTATNADLATMVSEGKFRADLYHRIKNVEINLPPLCGRKEDIEALIRHFVGLAGIEINGDGEVLDELVEALSSRDWTGNVRELKAEIEKLAVLHDKNIVAMTAAVSANHSSERERLVGLLNRFDWNRAKVAEALGITEGGVRYRMRKYNL